MPGRPPLHSSVSSLRRAPAKENKMFKFHLWDDLDCAESGIRFLWGRVAAGVARLKRIARDMIRKYRIARGGATIHNESQLARRLYFTE